MHHALPTSFMRIGVFARIMSAVVALEALPALADVTVINFDTFLDGATIPPTALFSTQWASLGVVFSNGAGGPVPVSTNNCSLSLPNHAYAPTIVVTFVDPVTGAPALTASAGTAQDYCWVPGEGIDMYAYDAAGLLIAHEFNAGGGHLVVFSFECPRIARLECYCILQGIDNLQFQEPVSILDADLNSDGMVDGADLGQLLSAWGPCGECMCPADLNLDGTVDGGEIGILLSEWSA